MTILFLLLSAGISPLSSPFRTSVWRGLAPAAFGDFISSVGRDDSARRVRRGFSQGDFAACGRRVPLPMAARRRKVRLSPFPPDGENCARSLAPPLPGEPAALGFAGSTGEINQNATGDGSG